MDVIGTRGSIRLLGIAVVCWGVVLASPAGMAMAATPFTARVSVGTPFRQANANSGASKLSTFGRHVTFASAATNLVAGDSNGFTDVFVRDRENSTTKLVSMARDGKPANGNSRPGGMGVDGRLVVFGSDASNIVTSDTNGAYDVFVRNVSTGTQSRLSVSTSGGQANGPSFRPSISAQGGIVAFDSYATNLVPGDTNGGFDVFVRNRTANTTRRISLGSGGIQANGESTGASVSADGRYVVYESGASNLVTDDINGQVDVFLRDLGTATTELVSVGVGGEPANGLSTIADVSGDGRYVVFTSVASNLVPNDTNGEADVFMRDRATGTTSRLSITSAGQQGNGQSLNGSVSDDGMRISFDSFADNLVTGDTNGQPDVFVRDRQQATTTRVSVSSSNAEGNQGSVASAISGDGRFVSFTSGASNLVPMDTNRAADIFVHRNP